MKFSRAIGLLVQTLPVLSEKVTDTDSSTMFERTVRIIDATDIAPKSNLQRHKKRRVLHAKRKFGFQVEGTLRNAADALNSHVHCDPTSTDADTGILSCGEGRHCEPYFGSDVNGVCTSVAPSKPQQAAKEALFGFTPKRDPWIDVQAASKQEKSTVQCNPASVDVGTLACGLGKYCKEDQSSGLGGYCISSHPFSRRLDTEDYPIYLCDPWPEPLPEGVCDCSGVNFTTVTGTMNCSRPAFNVYGCDEFPIYNYFWYTVEDSALVKSEDCYKVKAEGNQQICFSTHGVLNESCQVAWNGQSCNACSKNDNFYDFDCSNSDGGPVGNSRSQLSSLFEKCYTVPNFTCTQLCVDGQYIPEFNFDLNVSSSEYGDFNCGYLSYLEAKAYIPDYLCPFFTSLAQGGCCEPFNPPVQGSEENSKATPTPDDDDGAVILLTINLSLVIVAAISIRLLIGM